MTYYIFWRIIQELSVNKSIELSMAMMKGAEVRFVLSLS